LIIGRVTELVKLLVLPKRKTIHEYFFVAYLRSGHKTSEGVYLRVWIGFIWFRIGLKWLPLLIMVTDHQIQQKVREHLVSSQKGLCTMGLVTVKHIEEICMGYSEDMNM
jgi:hypothetical protein